MTSDHNETPHSRNTQPGYRTEWERWLASVVELAPDEGRATIRIHGQTTLTIEDTCELLPSGHARVRFEVRDGLGVLYAGDDLGCPAQRPVASLWMCAAAVGLIAHSLTHDADDHPIEPPDWLDLPAWELCSLELDQAAGLDEPGREGYALRFRS